MGQALLKQTDSTAQRKTIIVGLGKSGLSSARFLLRQGADVLVVDSRANPPAKQQLQDEFPAVETQFGCFDAELFEQAQTLLVSPGVSLREPAIVAAIEAGVEVVGDIELFARHAVAPVIAITGSNGKSTVTTMVADMAKAAGKDVRVGGNIGTPALDLLQENEPDLYVLELSSFQLETTSSLKPAAAVVLNVSQDHLDRYAGMKDYADTKQRIYSGAAIKLANLDDALVASWCGEDQSWTGFSLHQPQRSHDFGVVKQDGQSWLAKGEQRLLPVAELKGAGKHNVANALAALALAESVGLPMAAMLDALRGFSGLAHRCQWLAEQADVSWYNDSKATNVGAAVAAINGMTGQVVLLAGGEAKGQDFSTLREALVNKGRAAILFGVDADQIAAVLAGVLPVQCVASLHDAVVAAHTLAQAGDTVLLAPACASFDMFSGYEERGNQFAAAVAEVLA
ncbi:MAG TPA: UDP-N-acetylmuramoyl-L-alanine--D-glutamate ligase [Candidatus Tenderia electrophaga]|uniref:UDP-N-acetylmuramoylalanine--D-glutamate ligase n=1 Tax=Candidatus Tenderia electrophaga TaxID=1748243 RepID=A0A832N501_9GAMM|nr:UDP-N-acetylmuramoyl-L-alanine--D-glutamate ligase [Candidatus Tenderia electrophaga]